LVYQLRARLGERTFIECWKLFVKLLRENEAQHGVAQEFQPLVVRRGSSIFVGHGRVGKRQSQ
jgi:hypothetical protein